MIKRNFKAFLFLVVFFSLINLPLILGSGIITREILQESKNRLPKNWTLMIYFCADTRNEEVTSSLDNSENFLHGAMLETMNGLLGDLAAGSEDDINVIALYDYPYSGSYPFGHADINEFVPGDMTTVANWEVTNMGDEETLSDFVDFCKTNYPADNYALILSDHGRGYAGSCFDYHAPHPYWEYALGDCLAVPELGSALWGSNNVDVIIFNTCLGGSFEVAWQLVNQADYMIGGETWQTGDALYHPRELAYALSHDTDMTPLELAQTAFDTAVDPVLPGLDNWKSVSLYDLTKFPGIGGPNFMDTFSEFTDYLMAEIDYNGSKLAYFRALRNNMVTSGLESSKSMMVDLIDFLEIIHELEADFYYSETGDLASDLFDLLAPSATGPLIDEWHSPYYSFPTINGFSICFPDTYDMYQGFLYPNMYDDLRISIDTQWDDFISRLWPKDVLVFSPDWMNLYEVQMFLIDPSIHLHAYAEQYVTGPGPDPGPLHVGLNDDCADFHMGVELGIEDSEYHDDLLWGNAMIRIPAASLPVHRNGVGSFKVVVNATYAASATQQVNLTVRHYLDSELVWEENQVKPIEIGQALSCEVTTNDEWTELEPEEPTTTTPPTTTPPTTTPPTTESSKTGSIGPTSQIIFSTFILTFSVLVIFRKKIKK